jgi:hypothetical protein
LPLTISACPACVSDRQAMLTDVKAHASIPENAGSRSRNAL